MKISNKHSNPEPMIIYRADFSGGLNTTTNADGIAENQLLVAENVEVERNTGRLKTVAGTVELFWSNSITITAALYDEINKKILLVYADKSVHVYNIETKTAGNSIGNLTGNLYPVATSWEAGILIASGGKLQYYNGTALVTLNNSKDADFVYTRANRVVTTSYDNNVSYSAVGDETSWTDDTGDPSTSKFVEIGYKDGGNLIGLVNLSQDMLIIKNNRRVYRLSGEFPDWSVNEISRNVECSGRLSFCAVSDSVFILGKNEVQIMQTTQSYGDVKPQNIGQLIISEIKKLPENAKVRYVPPLNQIWCIGANGVVLMYDLNFNSWYKRKFNSDVVDVISIGDEVYVIKPKIISKLEEGTFFDSGFALNWKFQAQRLVSHNNYLLKRTEISVIPYSASLYSGQISVGAVVVPFPIPKQNVLIYKNHSRIYKNHFKISSTARKLATYVKSEIIYDNLTPIYGNEKKIFSRPTFIKESRNVFRSKFLDIKGAGSGGGFLLNRITMDIAEV